MELRDVMMGVATAPKPPDQNLIKPDKIEKFGDAPGFWKSIILDIFSVGCALFLGYAYFGYLVLGFSPWVILGAFIAFAAVSVMQVFLAPSTGRRALVILGESIAFTVVFSTYDSWQILVVTSVVAFLILFWGYLAGSADIRNSIELRFFKTTSIVLGKFTTAALVAMILIYVPQIQGPGVFIPKDTFGTYFDWTSGLLNNVYPGLSISGTFEDVMQSFAEKEVENTPAYQNLTVVAQKTVLEQTVAQLSGTIQKTTGVAPTPTEPASDVMYRVIVSVLNDWRVRLGSWFVVAWIVVIFLALRTIGIVFTWIAQLASLVVYETLLASGFMHIKQVTQMREIVEY